MTVPAKEWHRLFFKNSFYNPASREALRLAPKEAAFAIKKLHLRKNSRLLDLCCGPGRHAIHFAKNGLRVTGFDFSMEYLKEAGDRACEHGVSVKLIRGDMRRLSFAGIFDAAVSMFTSFGYFQKFSDDIKTLKGVAAALRPGGLFFIDLLNGDYTRNNFQPRDWHDFGDHYLLEDRRPYRDGVLNIWTKISKPEGKIAKKAFFTRLYGKRELSRALKKAGLKAISFWGGFSGEKFSDKSVRLICLAKKN